MFREKLPEFEASYVVSFGVSQDNMELIQDWKQKLSEQRHTEVSTDEALHFLLWLAGNTEEAGQE